MADEYRCQACGGTFEKGWTDEEAAAEAEERFPGLDVADHEDAAIVCDDCYRRMMGLPVLN